MAKIRKRPNLNENNAYPGSFWSLVPLFSLLSLISLKINCYNWDTLSMTPVLTDLGPAVTLVAGLRSHFQFNACNQGLLSALRETIIWRLVYVSLSMSGISLPSVMWFSFFYRLFLQFVFSMCTPFLLFVFTHGLLFRLQNIYIIVMIQGHPTMITLKYIENPF